MKLFFAVVLGLTALTSRSQAQNTGIDLQHECQAVFISGKTAEQGMAAAHCLGYISGVAYTMTMWQGINEGRHLGTRTVAACLPEKGTNEEYVKVVLHYLDEHPNQLHQTYGLNVFMAFHEAYPCPAK